MTTRTNPIYMVSIIHNGTREKNGQEHGCITKYAVARFDVGAALVPQSRGSVFEREFQSY